MRVLITGFEPFGGAAKNTSRELVKALPRRVGLVQIVAEELPVVFGRSADMLRRMISCVQPDVALSLGQAGTRPAVQVEMVARNIADARIPDNDGNQPRRRLIVKEGPERLGPTVPAGLLLSSFSAAGVPAISSPSAGTYLCNYLFYLLMHESIDAEGRVRAGFVHVPAPVTAAAVGMERIMEGLWRFLHSIDEL